MNLDTELRRMATELQDTALLARICGDDLIAIEAKYHYNCLSKHKNRYRNAQEAKQDSTISEDNSIVDAQVFVELVSHIEDSVEAGKFIFKLPELHGLYENHFKTLQVEKQIKLKQ